MDFYATAAQVIPTLFLAMAFESRVLLRLPSSYNSGADPEDPAQWNPSQIVGTMYLVGLMAGGEVSALVALNDGGASRLIDVLVWLGVLGGLLGVVLPVWAHQGRLLVRHLRAMRSWGQVLFVCFVLACLVFLTASVIGHFVS